jgi:hypothetical protein
MASAWNYRETTATSILLLAEHPLRALGVVCARSSEHRSLRATFLRMRFATAFFFAYFWFSPHPAAGEASA